MTALKRSPLLFVEESSNSKLHSCYDSSTTKEVLKVTLITDSFCSLLQVIFLLKLLINPQVSLKEGRLQKLFSTFPSEWPGVGLLLLRVLVACSLIVQGIGYVQMPNRSLVAWGLAALTFAGGAFLLAGLMTPFVAVLVAAGGIGVALSWIPLPGQALFDSYLAIHQFDRSIDSNSSSWPRCILARCAHVRQT